MQACLNLMAKQLSQQTQSTPHCQHSFSCLIQIREGPSRPGSAALGEGGLETRLAQAEACLVSGQLSAAASQLQKVFQVINWCPSNCEQACIDLLATPACYCMLAVGTMLNIDFGLTTHISKSQDSDVASTGH